MSELKFENITVDVHVLQHLKTEVYRFLIINIIDEYNISNANNVVRMNFKYQNP